MGTLHLLGTDGLCGRSLPSAVIQQSGVCGDVRAGLHSTLRESPCHSVMPPALLQVKKELNFMLCSLSLTCSCPLRTAQLVSSPSLPAHRMLLYLICVQFDIFPIQHFKHSQVNWEIMSLKLPKCWDFCPSLAPWSQASLFYKMRTCQCLRETLCKELLTLYFLHLFISILKKRGRGWRGLAADGTVPTNGGGVRYLDV